MNTSLIPYRNVTAGLGRTQRLVLQLLACDDKSVRTLVSDGFGLSESSVRGALRSLGLRGLVDRSFSYDVLVYHLTRKGSEVADALGEVDED